MLKNRVSKIKVIEFIPSLVTGGAEKLVVEYALRLKSYPDIEIKVFCLNQTNSPNERILYENGIEVIFLNKLPKLTGVFKPFVRSIKGLFKIRKIFKAEKPDVVHYHLSLSSCVFFSGLPKTTSVFYTQHNELFAYPPKEYFFLKKIIKKYRTRLIALNQSMMRELNSYFNVSDTVVLNNGIDISKFNKTDFDIERIRKEIGIDANDIVIGHVGRFVAQKNHSFIVEVFNEFLNLEKNAKLLLIGKGKEEDKVKALIKEKGIYNRVIILHDRTDINELMHVMNVFLFPSLFEGLGIVLIEAQCSGLYCLASSNCPKDSRISNHIKYLDLDMGTSVWADELYNLMKDKSKIEFYNLENWDINLIVKKLHDMYLE